jgi:uncharacterized protein (DUF302 family)
MTYHFSKKLDLPFAQAVTRVTETLKQEGFGVLTDIDVSATMKAKLAENFRPYRILGTCNPQLAHRALQLEDKIGTMLLAMSPCSVMRTAASRSQPSIPSPLCRQSRIPRSPNWPTRSRPNSKESSKACSAAG